YRVNRASSRVNERRVDAGRAQDIGRSVDRVSFADAAQVKSKTGGLEHNLIWRGEPDVLIADARSRLRFLSGRRRRIRYHCSFPQVDERAYADIKASAGNAGILQRLLDHGIQIGRNRLRAKLSRPIQPAEFAILFEIAHHSV